MLVQEYLRAGHTPDDLKIEYGIEHRRGKQYPQLVSLNYSLFSSPRGHALVDECRGLILDEADDFRVVARAFNRFYQAGEPEAAAIDWPTARVQEKLDGSLVLCYWYDGAWRIATRGWPDASGRVDTAPLSFAMLTEETFTACGIVLPEALRDYTLVFELLCPENRVVVRQQERRVVLLTVVHTESGRELSRSLYPPFCLDLPQVREFDLDSLAALHDSFATIDATEQEGYVVVDGYWRRLKLKHPQYVALHHLKFASTPRALLDVVRQGEMPELLAVFPELTAEAERQQAGLTVLVAAAEQAYAAVQAIPEQKAFALAVSGSRLQHCCFALRSGSASSARDYFATMPLTKLAALLQLPPEEELADAVQ